MSVFISRKYVNALGNRLERFLNKGNDVWMFRCPFCGDSKKSKFKARGHIYRRGEEFFYRCFNCQYSTTFGKLLKSVAPDLFTDYNFELFVEKKGVPQKDEAIQEMVATMKEENRRLISVNFDEDLIPFKKLPHNHKCYKYVTDRKIPEIAWKYLAYAPRFKAVAQLVDPKRAELLHEDDRLVIASYNQKGEFIGVIGRSLDPNNEQRYIHLKVANAVPKMFGLDKLKALNGGECLVTEGPIDSMFFDNAIATCDSNLMSAFLHYQNITLVFDNEPRNPNIVQIVKRAIDNGFRVCLFPEHIEEKDINAMILSGKTPDEIQYIIKKNTFEGLAAELEFVRWKKI